MTEWSERRRRVIRAGLVILAIPAAEIGIWATLAPRSFYDDFPGGGRAWVSADPPYNEHLVRDVGAFQLGLFAFLVFALVVMERRLVQAALVASATAATPHLIFHLTDTESLSTSDNVLSLGGQFLLVVVALGLLPLTRRTAERAPLAAPARGGAR